MNKRKLIEDIFGLINDSNTLKKDIELDENTSLGKEYGINSLDIIELIVSIEEHFNIEFNDTDLSLTNFDSISSIANIVFERLSVVLR